jgi:hypothetical protein
MKAGIKYDSKKDRFDRLPWRFLSFVALLLTGRIRSARTVPSGIGAPHRPDLLPMVAIHEVARVLGYGAEKYSARNWVGVSDWRRRYFAAALRHVVRWWLGERLDRESGLHHLACAACCVLFLLELDLKENRESNT